MKSRKHKSSHQRKSSPLADDNLHYFPPPQQPHPPSPHNKICNNHPLPASSLHLPADKRLRSKKPLHSQHRGPHSEHIRLPLSSKNNKKHQVLQLNLHQNQPQQAGPEETCREYLMLDSYFVPLSAHTEKQIMAQFFSQTVSTSSDISSCKENRKRKVLLDESSRIRKISLRQSQATTSECPQPIKQDKATSSNLIRKHTQEMEVTVLPELQEIATQYSERKQYIPCQISQPQLKQPPETLPQLLSKIESSALLNENHLKDLSSNDKEHFSSMLESLISRLKPSVKPKIKPILFQQLPPACPAELEPYCEAVPKKEEGLGQQVTLFDRMEEAVNYRYCQQMSWIHQNGQVDKQAMVDTSLFNVINFLCDLFCFIEIEYAEQFVENIRKMYGISYREKYKRAVRDRPREEVQLDVVGKELFRLFFQENQGDFNELEQYHCRAILDSLNEGLQRYRPYFLGNGEQFPWSLKLFVTMSEYSIDQDSLQIIFRESKDRLIEDLASLCGLLVEFPQEQVRRVPAENPIERRRKDAENKMVERWLEELDFERDEVEVENTRVMFRVAELVYSQLLGEVVGEGVIY